MAPATQVRSCEGMQSARVAVLILALCAVEEQPQGAVERAPRDHLGARVTEQHPLVPWILMCLPIGRGRLHRCRGRGARGAARLRSAGATAPRTVR